MKIVEIMYDFVWIIGAVFFYGVSLIPPWYLVKWGETLPFPWFLFVYVAAFFLFVITLMFLTGLVKFFLIPRMKEGKYRFPDDKQVMVWIMQMTITQYLLVPFNRIILLIPLLRYITYRLFGMKIHYSTVMSTGCLLRDFDMLNIGKNTRIGSWTMVYGHIQASLDQIQFGPATLGDNTTILAETAIGAGATIGDNVFIEEDCVIGLYSTTGSNSRIGYRTMLGNRTTLGENVIIGRNSAIGNRVQIKEGITIPDFSYVPDDTVVETQQQADRFSRISSRKTMSE